MVQDRAIPVLTMADY